MEMSKYYVISAGYGGEPTEYLVKALNMKQAKKGWNKHITWLKIYSIREASEEDLTRFLWYDFSQVK